MDGNKDRGKRAILIIDNDRAGAAKLKSLLNENAYQIYTTGTLKEARVIAEEKSVNVVLLAMGRSGLDPERIIKSLKRAKDDVQIPVIVILESFVEDLVASALKAGAVDYLTCPVDSQELARRTGVYARLKEEHRSVTDRRKGLLKGLLPRLSGGFHSLFNATELLEQRYEKVDRLGIGSFGEVWKVRNMEKDPSDIYVAKIPLSKKLNAKIEKEDPRMVMARNIALHHHQTFNGKGYPRLKSNRTIEAPVFKDYADYQNQAPLAGTEIPTEALIVGLADRYDALRSRRPYKEAYGHEKTLAVLKNDDLSGINGCDWYGSEIWQVFEGHHLHFKEIFEGGQN